MGVTHERRPFEFQVTQGNPSTTNVKLRPLCSCSNGGVVTTQLHLSQDVIVAPHPIVEADVIVCGDTELLAQYSVVNNLTAGTSLF